MSRALLTGDFGQSLSFYPMPVNQLIAQSLPWTVFLLLTSTIIAWVVGNFIGLLTGYRSSKFYSKALEGIAIFIYPIPYYILALVLIILFVYINPDVSDFLQREGHAFLAGIHQQRHFQLDPAGPVDHHRRVWLVDFEHESAVLRHRRRRFRQFRPHERR